MNIDKQWKECSEKWKVRQKLYKILDNEEINMKESEDVMKLVAGSELEQIILKMRKI